MEASLDSLSSSLLESANEGDPWAESIRLGCREIQEAEKVQPLLLSADPYRSLRKIWAHHILAKDFSSPPPALLKSLVTSGFLPAEAIRFLLFQKLGWPNPPLSSLQPQIGCTGLHLPELCQLTLLWAMIGEKERAQELALWLLNFALEKPLLSLWCPENRYDEREGLLSFSLLLRSCGQLEKSKKILSSCGSAPIDPFFIALAKKAPSFSLPVKKRESLISDPLRGLTLFSKEAISAGLTLSGQGTPLGMVRAGEIEIRAFGPQKLPLNELNGFGIQRIPDGLPMEGWTRCFALSQIWIEAKLKMTNSGCQLNFSFVGLNPKTPLAVVFYIKAQSCQTDSETYLPKSLKRYVGEASSLIFGSKREKLKIESGYPQKLQVIPLAGEGCFWDCEFLVSFEINPFASRVSFAIDHLAK